MLEDRRLIWKLRNGREEGLVRTYGKYKDMLLRLACVLCPDTGQAEDVVQDVFVALAGSVSRLRSDGNLRGYLIRSLINRVKNLKTAKHCQTMAPLSCIDEVSVENMRPDQWVILDEQLQRVVQALAQLPEQQRTVVALHVQAGLKFREIARLEQVSINMWPIMP